MPKCPSKFCDAENPEGARRCTQCGIDLDLPEREIKARDLLFDVLNKVSKEFKEDFKITRELIDTMVERHGATMLFVFVNTTKETSNQQTEVFPRGLYSILMNRLKKLEKRNGEIVKFPLVFSEICRNFKMTKKECWDILFMLNEFKMIELVPYHGIRLLY